MLTDPPEFARVLARAADLAVWEISAGVRRPLGPGEFDIWLRQQTDCRGARQQSRRIRSAYLAVWEAHRTQLRKTA